MKKNMLPLTGLLAGIILIMWSITMSGNVSNFIHIPSLMITIFGSFSALMISFPFKALRNIPNTLKLIFVSAHDDRHGLIQMFSDLSRKARKDGLLALEDDLVKMDDQFLVSGLQMVVDGVEPDSIRELLELKLDTTERRHSSGQEVFTKWGELAPAFGMIGTLIGLIVMLSDLKDPDSIGIGMATALITTFYGSFFANLVFIPIANNLSAQTEEEIFTGQMIIEGILGIQAGSNPRILEERLMTYLSPREQKLAKATKGEGRDVSKTEASYNE
jgi:chemotaxis protein MotA